MGNKVDIINEIYTRLNTAIGTGKVLAGVKRVQIGAREECRKLNDFPIINIRLMGGEETYHAQPHIKIDEISIEVSLVVNVLQGENSIYNTTGTLGGLYIFEKLLNTLDKTTADAIDLGFNNKGDNIPDYNYEIEYGEQTIEYILTLKVKSKQFTAGAR